MPALRPDVPLSQLASAIGSLTDWRRLRSIASTRSIASAAGIEPQRRDIVIGLLVRACRPYLRAMALMELRQASATHTALMAFATGYLLDVRSRHPVPIRQFLPQHLGKAASHTLIQPSRTVHPTAACFRLSRLVVRGSSSAPSPSLTESDHPIAHAVSAAR